MRSTLEGLSVPPWELCCIIGNLMDNAMDAAAGSAGRAHSFNRERGFARLYLYHPHNGAAIPEAMRERIFEPGVSTKGEGRGMGLSIVRATLKEFGGTIALAPGEETAFTVTVPRESKAIRAHGSITRQEGTAALPATHMERTKQKFLKNMVGFSMVTWVSFVLGFLATPYPPGFLSRRSWPR